MREAFQSDLQTIGDDLLEMAQHTRDAVRDASQALLDLDLALAERVIAADAHLDDMRVQLDEKIVELLARQSPVATDLRLLVSALRMSSSLERMGDLAEHIAMTARRSHPHRAVPGAFADRITTMAELVVVAIDDAATVIETRDLALAAQVEERDVEIDRLLQEVYRAMGRADAECTIQQAMDLTLLARFYERLGDHAVSLVRRVGFLVSGSSMDPRSRATEVPEI